MLTGIDIPSENKKKERKWELRRGEGGKKEESKERKNEKECKNIILTVIFSV